MERGLPLAHAEESHAGHWHGQAAYTFFRGFMRAESLLREERLARLPQRPHPPGPLRPAVYSSSMFCPECGSEYRDGYVHCRSCDVDLVEAPAREPDVALVKVYECGNAAIIPLVESLLADAGIEYMTKGEPIQDLFGLGRFGTNLSFVLGPVEFYVREDAATEARAVLASMELSEPDSAPSPGS